MTATRKRKRRIPPAIDGINGFVKARLTGNHVTLAVEGVDSDGPSVAGVGLPLGALDQLIRRLTDIRAVLARK